MKRAETSGRSDDNAETIKKRVQNYFDQSYPVIEYYKKFGKVRKIDALVISARFMPRPKRLYSHKP